MSFNSYNANPVRRWIKFPGINPISVPKKKYLKGKPTIGDATLTDTLGINGVKRKNNT